MSETTGGFTTVANRLMGTGGEVGSMGGAIAPSTYRLEPSIMEQIDTRITHLTETLQSLKDLKIMLTEHPGAADILRAVTQQGMYFY